MYCDSRMKENFLFRPSDSSNMSNFKQSNSRRCDFCALENLKCQKITETLFEFQGKNITTLEALGIFRDDLVNPTRGKEALICINCGAALKKCFSFTQQISNAQRLLLENRSKLSPEIELSRLHHLEKHKNIKSTFRPLLPKKEHNLNLPLFVPPTKLLRTYKCPDCPQIFGSFRQLKVHNVTHELDNISICKYCCSLVANAEALENHNNEKHADGKFLCPPCNRGYKQKGHLLKHIFNMHQRNQLIYYCCLCPPQVLPSMYDSKLQLQQHFQEVHLHMSASQEIDEVKIDMNEEFLDEFLLQNANDNSFQFSEWDELDLHLPDVLHINQQPDQTPNAEAVYKCPNCYEQFVNQKTLFVHLTQLHSLQFLVCNKCDANFQSHEELWQHKVTHRLQDKLQPSDSNLCKICDKMFKSAAALNYHVQQHSKTGSKPHKCPYCGKLFQTHKNLKQHLRIVHTQLKKHICQLCDKQFSTLDHLRKHVLSQHQNERKHICQVCSKRFTQLGHLKQHLEIHTTGKRIQCNDCCATFWRKIDLERHVLKHIQNDNKN